MPSDGLTFFRSAARGLQVPARRTPEPAKHEGRKPRANERPRVGCCEELARGSPRRCQLLLQMKDFHQALDVLHVQFGALESQNASGVYDLLL